MTLFWLRLAARTLLRRRARSGITVAAAGLGVATLTFLGSIMVGVNDAMIANSISLHTGHVLIRTDSALAVERRWVGLHDMPHKAPRQIVAVLPRHIAPAMLVTEAGAAPVQVIGVRPEQEQRVSAVPASVREGRYLGKRVGLPAVFVGQGAADSIGAKSGDEALLQLADGNQRRAQVVGVFHTGIERFDEGLAYTHLETVRELAPDAARAEVAVFLEKGTPRDVAERVVAPLLGAADTATSWEELLPELKQLTKLNVVTMAIVIILVVVMMAAGISNTVLVSVMDRYREFGVLKALGATPGEILRLIFMETMVLCLGAGSAGLTLGSVVTLLCGPRGIDLARFTSENPHFVLSSVIYPRLTWAMAVAPALAALLLGVLASLWPALIAARRRAADVMRLGT